jgi:hypothetical protein
MGCGNSTEQQGGKTAKSTSAKTAYAASVVSLTSTEERLLTELEQRTASHFSEADEPTDAVRNLRIQSIVTRGRVVSGVTADPEQYDVQFDIPEFKKKDRRRVADWVIQVCVVTYPEGPEPIPEDGFLPPSSRCSAYVPIQITVSDTSSFDLNTQDSTRSVDSTARKPDGSAGEFSTDAVRSSMESAQESARQVMARQQQQQQQQPEIHPPIPGTVA